MDSSQTPSSILDTLRTVEFRLGLKGYNVDEVDEYLDKAAQEAEGLQEHLRQLNDRLRQASERIAQLEREKRSAPAAEADESAPVATESGLTDETLQRTLILAQKFVDQTKRESEAEAAALIATAEETAQASIAAAEATAAQLQAESNQRLRDEVARLEATRTELATDVESMARHLDSERSRLRSTLSDLLAWVDENVQPANSLMGVKKPTGAKATPSAGDGSMPFDAEAGPPTMSLPNTTGAAASGAPRSV
jgi:DivIVA domain-containing protein